MNQVSVLINQEIVSGVLDINSLMLVITAQVYNQVQQKLNTCVGDYHTARQRDDFHRELKKVADALTSEPSYIGIDSVLSYSRRINMYEDFKKCLESSKRVLDNNLDLIIYIEEFSYPLLTEKMKYEIKKLSEQVPEIQFIYEGK